MTENTTTPEQPQLPSWTQGLMVHMNSMYSGQQTADLTPVIAAISKDTRLVGKYDKFWKDIRGTGSKVNLRVVPEGRQSWANLSQLIAALDVIVQQSVQSDPTSKPSAESWASGLLYEANRALANAVVLPTIRLLAAATFGLMGGIPSPSAIKKGRASVDGLTTVAIPINSDGTYSAASFRPLFFAERLPWARGGADPFNISLLYKQGKWGLMTAKIEADYGDHKERVEMSVRPQRTGGLGLQILSVRVSNHRPQGFAAEMSETRSYDYSGPAKAPYQDTITEVRTVANNMRGIEAAQITLNNILQKLNPEDLVNIEIFLKNSVG